MLLTGKQLFNPLIKGATPALLKLNTIGFPMEEHLKFKILSIRRC